MSTYLALLGSVNVKRARHGACESAALGPCLLKVRLNCIFQRFPTISKVPRLFEEPRFVKGFAKAIKRRKS